MKINRLTVSLYKTLFGYTLYTALARTEKERDGLWAAKRVDRDRKDFFTNYYDKWKKIDFYNKFRYELKLDYKKYWNYYKWFVWTDRAFLNWVHPLDIPTQLAYIKKQRIYH